MAMKTAIVIGAGPAGLTAAYELIRSSKDWHVIVLEASGEVGGMSRTIEHNGNRFDIGPHRFFSKSKEVNALWDRILPRQGSPSIDDIALSRRCSLADGGPDPEKTDRVMLRRHRLTRIYCFRHFFDYPISISLSTFIALGLVRTWKAGWSYLYSVFFKRPERSLEDFFINRFGKVLYAMFFEDYTEKLWGIHPSKIDPSWGAQRVKGLSLWKALINVFISNQRKKETSLIDEFSYPKLGAGQFWTELARSVLNDGGEIKFNSKVVKVDMDRGAITTESGDHYSFDAVFSSMPIKDLVVAMGSAPVDVAEIAGNLPYRDLITVTFLVDKLAIRNTSKFPTFGPHIPDVWIYVQDKAVRMGRLEIYNNFSPYIVDDPQRHVLFSVEYFCDEGDDFWAIGDREIIQRCRDELKIAGIISDETHVIDAVCTRTLKAYPAYFGSYAEISKVQEWLDGFANLYCIGRNGQHRYNNMDHSMLCGMEAVRALLNGTNKSALWNINTDDSYHESS